jgi:hypothetical protein
VAASDDLEQTRENLRQREKTKSDFVHFVTTSGAASVGVSENIRQTIGAWLESHNGVSACVWTGLPSNWTDRMGSEFSADAAFSYLKSLEDGTDAREYIQNAPAQIQTEVRAVARAQLGWQDAELPTSLFENV